MKRPESARRGRGGEGLHDRPAMVNELLVRSAERHPELPCLGFVGEEPLSYAEVAERVDALAARLAGDAIAPGDRVALLGENMPNWGIAYLAVNTCGAVVVPILPEFSVDDIAGILAHSGISACFVSRRYADKLASCGLANGVHCYLLDALTRIPPPGAVPPADSGAESGATPRLAAASPAEHRHRGQPDDLAALVYTSGTTGHSKGVMLSNRNLIFDAMQVSTVPGVSPGETFLSILPLAHTYECTVGFLSPISMGLNIRYLRRPPSATVLMPALQEVRPHLMLSVPLLIEKLYRQSVLPSIQGNPLLSRLYAYPFGRRLLNRMAGRRMRRAFGGRLYFLGIGGAPPSPEIEDFLIEAHFPYCVGYGLTETSPVLAAAHPRDMRPRSTGKAIPGIELKIDLKSEAGGRPRDSDSPEGEILVRGPVVMQGYYRDPDRTREVIDQAGWLHTGDLGSLDESGYLYIRGRVKTMILGPSGENIYPEAIESLINGYDFVEDSLVFQHQGQLLARIHLDYDAFLDHVRSLAETAGEVPHDITAYLNELRQRVNNRVSSFARIGRVIEQRDPFEKTPTEKIRRFLYDTLSPAAPPESPDLGRGEGETPG